MKNVRKIQLSQIKVTSFTTYMTQATLQTIKGGNNRDDEDKGSGFPIGCGGQGNSELVFCTTQSTT